MNDIIEYLKIVLPVAAIGISVFSLIVSKKNFKRQIRIAKLEEMFECFYYVCTYYSYFRILIEDLKELGKENKYTKVDIAKKTSDYIKKLDYLKEKEVFEKIIIKSNRIGILSNSYLPNGKLKLQINSTYRLINSMAESIQTQDLFPINSFSEKLPGRSTFAKLIEKTEREIIKEMDLGYESQKWDDLNKYYKNDFKKELGIE